MKLIFAGSSEFAIPILEEILALRRYEIPMVISQAAKPTGRKLLLQDTPLATAAKYLGHQVFTPEDINSEASIAAISALHPDVIITASYGAFLGKTLRKLATFGAINLHPSLLPKYRGASPIRAALLAGDDITGNTIFRLNAKMDAGKILVQEKMPILPGENYSHLQDRLANQAAMMLVRLLSQIATTEAIEQPSEGISYSQMISKADAKLDFGLSALELQNRIRAFAMEPGAYCLFRGSELKLLEAEPFSNNTELPVGSICQTIKNTGFTISTADGELLIRTVQAAGKKVMNAWAYSLGARFNPGERMVT